MNFFMSYWKGERTLYRAFLVIYFPITFFWIYTLFATSANNFSKDAPITFIVMTAITILLRCYAIVVVWNCAPNNRRKSSVVSFFARAYVAANSFYLVITSLALIGFIPSVG
ncbi:MAG TPA: hypothetical protein DCE52_03285 [Rhodobacteraceae bacterium]|nr:hypothetical protein [Paracoccaceae bacterium]